MKPSSQKRRSDWLIMLDGCVVLFVLLLVLAIPVSTTTLIVLALDLEISWPTIPLGVVLVWVGLIVSCFVGAGVYVGYRTRRAGWLFGALMMVILVIFSLGTDFKELGHPDWEDLPYYPGIIALGALGGFIGQKLKARSKKKTVLSDDEPLA